MNVVQKHQLIRNYLCEVERVAHAKASQRSAMETPQSAEEKITSLKKDLVNAGETVAVYDGWVVRVTRDDVEVTRAEVVQRNAGLPVG